MKVYARSGDSLWKISQLFDIPLMILEDSNRNLSPNLIAVGEEINVPGFLSDPYTIQEGDSPWKIAAALHLPPDTLFLLNQHLAANKLQIGETIDIPKKITFPCFQANACDCKKLDDTIRCLTNLYPFITVNTIGRSILGNPIQEIKVGSGEKKVHINAAFHANEWITTLIAMSLLNTYLLSLTRGIEIKGKEAETWYRQVELSLVPMVNPDGVDLVLNGPPSMLREEILAINSGSSEFVHWKANIRGVDLNKQYPANWEIDKKRSKPKCPSPRDYPGESPLTEPEAIALANLAKKNQFACVLAFHTQGEEFYWGYEGYEPEESAAMAKEFEDQCGYRAIQYIDSHGGYKDWYIKEFKRPGFTIEFGRGINPLPLSHFKTIITKAERLFFAALSMQSDY